MSGQYAINWTSPPDPNYYYEVRCFIAKTSYNFQPLQADGIYASPMPDFSLEDPVNIPYISQSDVPNTTLVDRVFDVTVPSIAGVSISGVTLTVDTALWDATPITVSVYDVNAILSNVVSVTIA